VSGRRGVHHRRPVSNADIVITGDRPGPERVEYGADIGRVPSVGWSEVHDLQAVTWCAPRRYAVVREDGRVLAADSTNDPTVLAGEVSRLRVPAPPRP
jgi:hypothetical protein